MRVSMRILEGSTGLYEGFYEDFGGFYRAL